MLEEPARQDASHHNGMFHLLSLLNPFYNNLIVQDPSDYMDLGVVDDFMVIITLFTCVSCL